MRIWIFYIVSLLASVCASPSNGATTSEPQPLLAQALAQVDGLGTALPPEAPSSGAWNLRAAEPGLELQSFAWGLLCALALSSALAWFFLREKILLAYAALCGSLVALLVSASGRLDGLAPLLEIRSTLPILFVHGSMISFLCWLKYFYETPLQGRWPRLFPAIIAIHCSLMPLGFWLGWRLSYAFAWILLVGISLLALFSAGSALRHGFRPAIAVILGRTAFLGGCTVYYLRSAAVPSRNLFTDSAFYLGSLIELFFLALGLASQLRSQAQSDDAPGLRSHRVDWLNTLVRVITHDLSTPISVISTSVDGELRRPQPSASLQPNLERIRRAVNQQTDLVNHVREMMAVTTGKKALTLVPIDVNKKLDALLLNFAEAIKGKDLRVQIERCPETLYVLADATALEYMIFGNFMSNAIKFSQKKGLIRIILLRQGKQAVVRFEDQGIGVPRELISILFDPTKATSRRGTANENGTGFGLPIAAVYIEQFNGRVSVRSRVAAKPTDPSGTTFEIRFPICRAVSAAAG